MQVLLLLAAVGLCWAQYNPNAQAGKISCVNLFEWLFRALSGISVAADVILEVETSKIMGTHQVAAFCYFFRLKTLCKD